MSDHPSALADRLARDVPGLRAVLLFGSTLSVKTRKPTSIPDLFAIVDDVGAALPSFDPAPPLPIARWLARPLPPVTFALREPASGDTLAKVNLVTFEIVRTALARIDDLSLAGRLAKKTRLLWTRDENARAETEALLDAAADVMARATMLSLPRVVTLDEASRRCFALSYRAEPRPENAAQIALRYGAFADHYLASYGPRLASAARALGIEVAGDILVDRRPASDRRRTGRALAQLLIRSRLRALVRWSRQLLLYRGWLPYLFCKLRRV